MKQTMSRAQRILTALLLLKLSQPRIIQRITELHGGGGITEAMAVAAVEAAASLSLSGYLDLPEITPPANPAADTLRLYVEDFKGFSFFSFRDTTGMVRKLVRDSVFVGKNVTGVEIPANRAVYAVGSVDGVPSLAKARSNDVATMPCIGVTLEAIANNAFGRVMQVGLVENVDTSAFAAGDVLYVSSTVAGILVATAPLYPNIRQEIGTILVSDAAVGQVQVVARSMFNEGILDHGGMLGLTDDDHAIYALLAGRAGGQTLVGDTASGGDLTLSSTSHVTKGKIILDSDLDTGVNDIIFDSNLMLRRGASGRLDIVNEAGTAYRNIALATLTFGTLSSLSLTTYLKSGINGETFFRSYTGAAWVNVCRLGERGVNGTEFDIMRGGDITMLTDKMIQLSDETTGPAAAVGNRGKLRLVHGGGGVADVLYMSMKSAADTYSWVTIATG